MPAGGDLVGAGGARFPSPERAAWAVAAGRQLAVALHLVVSIAACSTPGIAAEVSWPLDCLPDRVVWDAAGPDPQNRFGAPNLPGVVSGPPGDSTVTSGATSVASLGLSGQVSFEFRDLWIEDRPGPDFIVFENAFFSGPVPGSAGDAFLVFAEPMFVEVSVDGNAWVRFPSDAAALDDARGRLTIDDALYGRLAGLAGRTPTLTGNWTVADDPQAFDLQGVGGVSGAGGDAFDLADVGLTEARFVRLIDAGGQNGFPGPAEGADVDAVVVLHGRPETASTDSDADGLSDLAELQLYGSDPNLPDSDADGIDDGREVAGCRNPSSSDAQPWLNVQPRLWLDGANCTEARWSFLGTTATYSLIRGELTALSRVGTVTDLGPTQCLVDGTNALRWSCDAEVPATGQGWFFLVGVGGSYGYSGRLEPRQATVSCP